MRDIMKQVNKYKNILYFIGIYFLYVMVLTILNYLFNNINFTLINYIFNSVFFLIFGIKIGKKTVSRAYLNGLKCGLIISLILFLINIILIKNISTYTVIYYILIIISTTIGSMIGINIKKK